MALIAPAQAQELLVAAAADLALAQEPVAEAVRREAGMKVRFVLGSSGMLARQIEQGAPYDLYLSANERFVAELVASGRVLPESVRVYAVGRLGLWSRNRSVRGLTALVRPGIRHVAIPNPTHAPYGFAARQALESQGLWKAIEKKIVYGENVRQALQYAESGNAEAVITAWSLVRDKGAVLLPDAWHSPIRQAAGIVAGSGRSKEARQFLDFLMSPAGQKLLNRYGFFPPR